MGGPLLLAYVVSFTLLAGFNRLPLWMLRAAPFIGIVVLGLAAYDSGHAVVGVYAMFLFWVVVAAAYLFPPWIAILCMLAAVDAFAIVLSAESGRPTLTLLGASIMGGLAVAGLLVAALRSREDRLLATLESAARTDPLTGLVNRRGFEERFEEELARAQRDPRPLGLAVLDLDNFKRVNDELGHEAGDAALVRVADALRRSARTPDIVARIGGEEFAVLLPETSLPESFRAAERLRHAIDLEFQGWIMSFTASCGVVAFPDHGAAARELMRSADRALYTAKDLGRARTIIGAKRRGGGRTAMLLSLAEEVDRRKGGSGDTWRSGLYAAMLGRILGFSGEHAEQLGLAARLQDVGEIGIPEEMLSSPHELGSDEWSVLRRHPEISARMVQNTDVEEVSEWIASHHECMDASGYPLGLREDEIPIEARILSVAGAYAAMQGSRSYRAPLSPDRAKEELRAGAGTRFDPTVVEAFLVLCDGSNEE